ncbi:MAG: hypothetical protein WCF03_06230 [Nitrososphaeraceae archaeon]
MCTKPYYGPLGQLRRNEKMHFLGATRVNVFLPPKMENSFVNVLIDFLTIRKYRKKDINNIS